MRDLDAGALDRYITGNYGEDQYEDCLACEDEGDVHTCELAEYSWEDARDDAAIAAWEASREEPDHIDWDGYPEE